MSASAHETRRARRWIPAALLVLAAATLALLVVTRGGTHHYRVLFDNAGQLVKGDVVRIGGTKAGRVDSVELSSDNRAEIGISVDDAFAPLHEGSTATIRAQGLAGVANRYVDISPAPDFRPALEDGAQIGGENSTSIVEIDQLFDTLDPKTRKGLKNLIDGSASWYQGREQLANASARQFPKALAGLSRLSAEITRDDGALRQFLVQTGDAMSALDDRRAELTDLVTSTRLTAQALSSDTASLSAALRDVPPALRQGSDAFAALRPALVDLRRLTDATGPATKDLAPFLRRLRPVLDEATPTFHRLRQMFAQPGTGNDLLDALRDLPALDTLTAKGFPDAQRALKDSTPVFSFVRPYTPDLVGWVRNFGQAMAPYDANGHYARTEPIFDAFSFVEDADGGHLVPKPVAERGQSPNLHVGNLRRCPGAAAPAPPDGSAPFVDNGPLANSDCDPSQRPGTTP